MRRRHCPCREITIYYPLATRNPHDDASSTATSAPHGVVAGQPRAGRPAAHAVLLCRSVAPAADLQRVLCHGGIESDHQADRRSPARGGSDSRTAERWPQLLRLCAAPRRAVIAALAHPAAGVRRPALADPAHGDDRGALLADPVSGDDVVPDALGPGGRSSAELWEEPRSARRPGVAGAGHL